MIYGVLILLGKHGPKLSIKYILVQFNILDCGMEPLLLIQPPNLKQYFKKMMISQEQRIHHQLVFLPPIEFIIWFLNAEHRQT